MMKHPDKRKRLQTRPLPMGKKEPGISGGLFRRCSLRVLYACDGFCCR